MPQLGGDRSGRGRGRPAPSHTTGYAGHASGVHRLVAAHKLIIPGPSKYLDWQALHLLLDTVIKVRHPVVNPDLEVAGVLVTLHDKRTRSGREIAEVLKGDTDAELLKFPFEIPYAGAFPDASLEGRSLVALAREPGATIRQKELASPYHALAKEVTNGAHAPASA
jgi:chromosome partitioning protein